jgi:hypothetical protein
LGLGLHTGAVLNRRGLFRRRPSAEAVLGEIERAVDDCLRPPLPRQFLVQDRDEEGLHVTLHPAGAPIDVATDEHGHVVLSAMTNAAGPGFHAAVVDLVDGLAERCDLTWRWSDAAGAFGDETGYQESRDFTRLQVTMLEWLQDTARCVLELEDDEWAHVGLCMPLGTSVIGDYFAVSPLGYWARDWLERVAEEPVSGPDHLGATFFPWWNRELDASFWLNAGKVLCWIDLSWSPPRSQAERDRYQLALDCFERARGLDARISLPDREIGEIGSLLLHEGVDRPPERLGIGFRRGLLRRPLTGRWTIALPGYFRAEDEEDVEEDVMETATYRFADRTVRGSSFRAKADRPGARPANYFVRKRRTEYEGDGPTFDVDESDLNGFACVEDAVEDGEAYRILHGIAGRGEHLCILTIAFTDPSDEDWAVEVWRSISLAPDDGEPA